MSSIRFPKNESKGGIGEEKIKVFRDQEAPNPKEIWTDNLFPPTKNSLLSLNEKGQPIDPKETGASFNPSNIEWKRASDIFPEPYLFENDISVNDVTQGNIGNCYFMSSIAAMCEYPGLITKIFLTKEYNPYGFYKLRLFIDGEYQIVYLDDYFPCLKGSNVPFFARPNSFELWALLLEKAWAKINGGYSNIQSGWPCDVFRTLTGFSCEKLTHKTESPKRVWEIIRSVDKSNGIICSSTERDEEIEKVGLDTNHTYTLIDTEKIEDDKKRIIHLCKLRNPWGESRWKGDWCKGSKLWTAKAKSQVDETSFNLNEGEFFISIEDLCKYFYRTDLCQIVYNGFIKTFDFPQKELNFPQVFNFYVPIKGTVSISIIEKYWRFNRELRGINHPTSLIIAEYDTNEETIKDCFCDFQAAKNCEKTCFLNPGNYIVWAYKGLGESEKPFPESMKVRFISDCKIKIKHIGPDKNFQIIQQIIYYENLYQNLQPLNDDENNFDFNKEIRRGGLSYQIITNTLDTENQKCEVDSSSVLGYSLLPPYSNQEKFNFIIAPYDYNIIIGIQKKDFGHFNLKLNCDKEQYEGRKGENFEIKRPSFNSFCLRNIDKIEFSEGERTDTLEELSKREKYPIVDHSKVFAEKFYKKYPDIKDSLLKMKPQPGSKKLGWIELEKYNGTYIGEANSGIPQGRGMFYFSDEEKTYVGYFDKGMISGFGKLYDKNKRLVYEGEYKNGKKNGKGTYYYSDGDRYEGEFANGLREGHGKFTWDDGTSWEGSFVDNEMEGEGTYDDGFNSSPVTYRNGNPVQ